MSDESTNAAAEPETVEAKGGLLSRISLVWLIPALALLISLGAAYRNYADQGVLIEITFADASGVRADETQLRYRDVVVGLVEEVRFSSGLDNVIVGVRVDQDVAQFIDADASFWVVRPEVSAQGISGLDTVLSGVYLQGSWDGDVSTVQTSFEGLGRAPLTTNGSEGLRFSLRANNVAGLSENAPITYRGITVGRVGNLRLADDGVSVLADGFVREPEARLINSATRFWDTSGFDFSFGASGAQFNIDSIASLVSGGVSFATTVSGGEALEAEPVFRLFDNEDAARSSVFEAGSAGEPVNFTVIFDDSVPGLEVGADVEFAGIIVGRVAGLTGVLDEENFGDRGVRLLVTLELEPGSMGLPSDATQADVLDFLEFAVQNGLRAQLQSASLLGGLQVTLAQIDDPDPAEIVADAEPFPRLPAIPADLTDFADTAEGVFNRVNNLPIEELLNNAILVMQGVTNLLNDEGVTETPAEVLALLSDVRSFVNSEGIQEIPVQLNDTMTALTSTAGQLNDVVTRLNEAGAVTALVDALTAAEEAANAVYETMEEGPATVAAINATLAETEELIATVNELPLIELVNEVEGSVEALRTLLASDATQGLTGDVSTLLTEVEGLIADVRASGLVETANATLVQLQTTVTEVQAQAAPILTELAQAAATTNTRLPGLLDNIDLLTANLTTVTQNVSELPLDQVVGNVDQLVASVNTLVSSDAVAGLPADVQRTVQDLQLVFATLTEENGILDNANGLVTGATTAVEETTQTLNATLTQVRSQATPLLRELRQVATTTNARLPGVVTNVETLTQNLSTLSQDVAQLPLDQAVANVNELVTSLNTLVSSEAANTLPAEVQRTLQDLQLVFAALTEENGVLENANTLIVDADAAVTDITTSLSAALTDIQAAAQDVAQATDVAPEIADRAKRVADQIELLVNDVADLPIQEIGARTESLLASADILISSPDTQRVPGALANSLEEVQRLLIQVQEGGLIENANATLSSVRNSVDAIPALLTNVGGLLTQTGTVIEGYDQRGALGSEVQATLRDIQSAASSIDNLARQIERNPNSLLFGR